MGEIKRENGIKGISIKKYPIVCINRRQITAKGPTRLAHHDNILPLAHVECESNPLCVIISRIGFTSRAIVEHAHTSIVVLQTAALLGCSYLFGPKAWAEEFNSSQGLFSSSHFE